MSRAYLGIDLGTSSVKVLMRCEDGSTQKAKKSYSAQTPDGWAQAVIDALSGMHFPDKLSIGLSSQVGTYIVNERDVLSWNSDVGKEEVDEIRQKYSRDTFIREISMPHPAISSYPIPRLTYIQKRYGDGATVCQPKDFIGRLLTGTYKTDKYSWRGLANMETGAYSSFFLRETGNPRLPELAEPWDLLGTVTEEICNKTGIPKDTPVYIGLNDYFASLLGMGIDRVGAMFDITGTSEHLGVICDSLMPDTSMVSGPYLRHFVHYGVTASSGASLDFAIRELGLDDIDIGKSLSRKAPIFTPYVNGERAPVFDSNAKGTFFGISADCTKEDMAYAVLEGVAFSLYHIYESMGCPACRSLTVSGGASKNAVLNTLKAELFGVPVHTLKENDTSALGAAWITEQALGRKEAGKCNEIADTYVPNGQYRDMLLKRYSIYKNLYASLKEQFVLFSSV